MSDFITPPPASTSRAAVAKPGPLGWGAVAAGVLGLLALVLPWYSPRLSKPVNGGTDLGANYYAWDGFFFLVAAPVLLMLFAVLWFQALRGQPNSRLAGLANPTRSLSLRSIGAGTVAVVLGLLSVALMTHHYKDWDAYAKAVRTLGATVQKNPQPGLYALLVGAMLLIVVGIAGLVTAGARTAAPAAATTQDGQSSARDGHSPPVDPPQS